LGSDIKLHEVFELKVILLDKTEFTQCMLKWLQTFSDNRFSHEYDVEIIIPNSNLNIMTNSELSKISNIGLMEFKPDILGILTHKTTKKSELIFLNRETKKFGLKELGEMLCYCRIATPKLAFMASLQGLSPPVDRLINHQKRKEVISFGTNNIVIFRWDTKSDSVDKYSVTPIESKSIF